MILGSILTEYGKFATTSHYVYLENAPVGSSHPGTKRKGVLGVE